MAAPMSRTKTVILALFLLSATVVVGDIKRTLARFVSDRQAIGRTGRNGRRLAEREFCRDKLSDRARGLVHSVVSGSGTESKE